MRAGGLLALSTESCASVLFSGVSYRLPEDLRNPAVSLLGGAPIDMHAVFGAREGEFATCGNFVIFDGGGDL